MTKYLLHEGWQFLESVLCSGNLPTCKWLPELCSHFHTVVSLGKSWNCSLYQQYTHCTCTCKISQKLATSLIKAKYLWATGDRYKQVHYVDLQCTVIQWFFVSEIFAFCFFVNCISVNVNIYKKLWVIISGKLIVLLAIDRDCIAVGLSLSFHPCI